MASRLELFTSWHVSGGGLYGERKTGREQGGEGVMGKKETTTRQQPLNLMLATVRQSVSVSFCAVCAWRRDGSF